MSLSMAFECCMLCKCSSRLVLYAAYNRTEVLAWMYKFEVSKKKIEWGSQIRSYLMQPYKMVKDVRTGHETSNVQAVLDGDLDGFIKSYLMEFGGESNED